jgi:transcriptional regulator with GAF, ATPase, and Fis domain
MTSSTDSEDRPRKLTATFNEPGMASREWLRSESRTSLDFDPITRQRELVQALTQLPIQVAEQSAKALEELLDFSSSLSLDTDSSTLLDRIVEATSKLGIAERVLVVMRDGELLRAVREFGEGGVRVPPEEVAKISETLVRNCLRSNQIDLRSNIGSDPELKNVYSIARLDLHSSVCVPLRAQGHAIGVLYLDSRRHLQQSDLSIRLLSAFAGHASLCLTHRNAVEEARRHREKLSKERDMALEHLAAKWRAKMVGKSAVWRRVIELVDIYRDHPHPILVLGETGSGKDVVATALTEAGIRTRSGPFVRLDCTAIPETLQDAEMFGTVRGAFTGAKDRPGIVEHAHGGTLFLDEVGDMALSLQAKMLTFLESGRFHRLGDPTPREVDVRVIAATNRPLPEMIEEGRFRQDLFYRLKGARIDVPPLRKRLEDIPFLADHFLAVDARARKRSVPMITPNAERALMSYRWPGNVRELRRAVQNAFTQAEFEDEPIDVRHIRAAINETAPGTSTASSDDLPERLDDAMRQVEQALLERTLKRYKNNTRLAAVDLGVTRQTVYNLMRKHGIHFE